MLCIRRYDQDLVRLCYPQGIRGKRRKTSQQGYTVPGHSKQDLTHTCPSPGTQSLLLVLGRKRWWVKQPGGTYWISSWSKSFGSSSTAAQVGKLCLIPMPEWLMSVGEMLTESQGPAEHQESVKALTEGCTSWMAWRLQEKHGGEATIRERFFYCHFWLVKFL